MTFIQLAPGSLKANLALFLPALLEIVVQRDFAWSKIEKLLNKQLNGRIVQLEGMESMLVNAHLADIIIESKKGNGTAIGLLDFLNKVCEELSDNLLKNEKELISSNVRQMLTAFDHRYLDFAGELAVLNNLVKSGQYRLDGIEKCTPNSKPIDFQLRSISNERIIYVEIVSIHLNADRTENDSALLEKFINTRLLDKINKKMVAQEGPRLFYLIPVLWGDAKSLEVYCKFFRTNELKFPGVLQPCAFLMQTNGKDIYHHRFGKISDLFHFPLVGEGDAV